MSDSLHKNTFASAISLDAEETPRVIAQGHGSLARQIEATARQHNIPVLQDFALSEQLSTIALGGEIPMTLFTAIAEVLSYILELEAAPESKDGE